MSKKDSSTIGETIEDTKDRHTHYYRAVQNPVRRNILRSMQKGNLTIEDLTNDTGLNAKTLEWHIKILEYGFCVEREEKNGKPVFSLTQEGKVINFLDK